MTGRRRPAAPKDLGPRGAKFWREILKVYELNTDEIQLFIEACRTIDECEALRERIQLEGETVKGSMGQTRVHPALSELRQSRALLAKLLGQLDLPDPQAVPASPNSNRASKAAEARWSRNRAHQEAKRRGQIS